MSLKVGIEAEEKASSYLIKEGVLHFFEVKFSQKYDPITRITPSKMSKIIKTINYYLLTHGSICDYQIDAILVMPNNIEIIKNISY